MNTDFSKAAEDYRLRLGRTPKVEAALIDMDGVLYDSMKYHARSWHTMMAAQGLDIPEDEFYLYEGMTGRATIDLLFRRHKGRPATPAECERLYHEKTELFRALGRKERMPGAADMLRALARADIRRILVTGSGQASLLSAIQTDFPGAFMDGDMVTARDVTRGKPDPEPYLRGLEKAGSEPHHALVIENAPLGVEAGHRAGCFVVAVATGPIPHESLVRAGADLVFPSMSEFAASLPQLLKEISRS